MKIVCLPLDARPYNYDFLQSLAAMDSQLTLVMPPRDLLGFRKTPAHFAALTAFIEANMAGADALILSLDMLIYGGLLPARTHHLLPDVLRSRLDWLRQLHLRFPAVEISASSLILRTPAYNSAEEEPDYYAHSGRAIWRYGILHDRAGQSLLTQEEQIEYQRLAAELDSAARTDFEQRRQYNIAVTQAALDLVADGVLTCLLIPQDDASPFGYTAMDQRQLYRAIAAKRLQDRVWLHPGTDESGCTLLTRAWLTRQPTRLNFAVCWSNQAFRQFVPNYEDRPFEESLLSHSRACGIALCDDPENADALLGINGCGEVMQEGWMQHNSKALSYYRNRSLTAFCDALAPWMAGKPVGIADVAFSNGGERELIEMLDHHRLLDRLIAYAGWNTACNTLGTVLAALAFACRGDRPRQTRNFMLERLVSDWAYQSEVRFAVQETVLPALGASYAQFGEHKATILATIATRVKQCWQQTLCNSFSGQRLVIDEVRAPFKRMSGLAFSVSLKPPSSPSRD